MSDESGNGAAAVTLAQQVTQLRADVEGFKGELEANRWQFGTLEDRWSKNLTAAIAAERAARDAEKAANDTRQYCMTRFDEFSGRLDKLNQTVEQLAGGVQVLVERKSVKRGRKG